MTREEAIKILKGTLDCNRLLTSGTNEKCVRNQCDDCDLMYEQGTNAEHNEALNMAIRSLEAWDKVIKDATERTVTFIPKSLEGDEAYDSAFYDGVNYVIDIIKGHLGEVEE